MTTQSSPLTSTIITDAIQRFESEYAAAHLISDGSGTKSDFVPKDGIVKAFTTLAALVEKSGANIPEDEAAKILEFANTIPTIMSFKTSDQRRSAFASYSAKLEYFVHHIQFATT